MSIEINILLTNTERTEFLLVEPEHTGNQFQLPTVEFNPKTSSSLEDQVVQKLDSLGLLDYEPAEYLHSAQLVSKLHTFFTSATEDTYIADPDNTERLVWVDFDRFIELLNENQVQNGGQLLDGGEFRY